SGKAQAVAPGTSSLSAAQLMSVLPGMASQMGIDTTGMTTGQVPPPYTGQPSYGQPPYGQPPETGPPVYGRKLFQQATSQFQPVTTGPVPSNYRVGPGDELILVLTGGVQAAYQLPVTRQGWIVIPDVGRVYVSGKTMDEVRETLFQRLSQSYSGIKKGPGATTHFDVAVGNLRTDQVYVIGEVERPAAYTVSSLATALTALYYAGGPTRDGSFRDVLVNRGDSTVAHIDLYDYLLKGKAGEDVRLEQGDIVYVPVARKRVDLEGAVRRPGIYELTGKEGLADAIRFAGGLASNAELRRVQIQRVLPPAQRTPGHDRALLDVPVTGLLAAGDSTVQAAGGRAVPLVDGDQITVFAVLSEVRNQVTVSGGVWRPGTYAAGDSTRLWDIIDAAGGLVPDAYQGRAQIQRLQPDYTRRLIPISLATDSAGHPLHDPRIEGMDQVIVFAERNLREDQAVSIGGWVQNPGVYPFVEGMTVADLILKAGGLRTGAFTGQAEVARVVISQTRSDTLTRRYLVPLDSSFVFDATNGSPSTGPGGGGSPGGQASRFTLDNLDAVYIRKAPGFEPQQKVVVTGEVQFPGPYSIRTREERLTDLIKRAGGLTEQAYPEGFQLWRAEPVQASDTLTAAQIAGQAVGDTTRGGFLPSDTLPPGSVPQGARMRAGEAGGTSPFSPYGAAGYTTTPDTGAVAAMRDSLALLQQQLQAQQTGQPPPAPPTPRTRVGIDFQQALRHPNGSADILIEPGDSIYVPRYVPTVDVEGAVGVQTKVLWREGEGVDYYINRAGGYAQDADKGRTRVRFSNGQVAARGSKFLIFGGGLPDPDPGSTITVPTRTPKQGGGISVGQLFGILTSIATAAATLIIASKK
nr:SLBB domain-containing protein [Candidatus Palauibacterales bacterium]